MEKRSLHQRASSATVTAALKHDVMPQTSSLQLRKSTTEMAASSKRPSPSPLHHHHHHHYHHQQQQQRLPAASDISRQARGTVLLPDRMSCDRTGVTTRSPGNNNSVYRHRKQQTPLPELPAHVTGQPREVEMTRAMRESFDSCGLDSKRLPVETDDVFPLTPPPLPVKHRRSTIQLQQQGDAQPAAAVYSRQASVSEVTLQAGRVLERLLSGQFPRGKDYNSELEGSWRRRNRADESRTTSGFYSDTGAGRAGAGALAGHTEHDLDTESDYVDMMHLLAEMSLASTVTSSSMQARAKGHVTSVGYDGGLSSGDYAATTNTTGTTASSSIVSCSHSPRSNRNINAISSPHILQQHHEEELTERDASVSSSSTEDNEHCDAELQAPRKKKSLLKRAKEQLRHTFRHFITTAGSPGAGGPDSEPETTPRDQVQDPRASVKLKKKKKRKVISSSSSSGSRVTLASKQQRAADSSFVSAGDGGQLVEGRLGRDDDCISVGTSRGRRGSPVPWKHWEVRRPAAVSSKVKDKEGILDSFLRPFRKNTTATSSPRSKNKSQKDRQRYHSADNLYIRRQLTADEQRLVSRYAPQQQQKQQWQYDDVTAEVKVEVMQGGSLHRAPPKHLTAQRQDVAPVHRPVPLRPGPPAGLTQSSSTLLARSFSTPSGDDADVGACQSGQPARSRTPAEHVVVKRGLPPSNKQQHRVSTGGQAATGAGVIRAATPVELVFVAPGQVSHQHRPPALLLRTDNVDDHDYVQIEGDEETPGELYDKIGVTSADHSNFDVCDGPVQPADVRSKAHHDRTESEKDEMYEKIAQQLAFIADSYGGPLGAPVKPTTAAETSVRVTSDVSNERRHANSSSESSWEGMHLVPEGPITPAERQAAALLREKGDTAGQATTSELVEQLVHNASYSTFKEVVGQRLGPQVSWQQVARMFRLTQVAVQCAGMGSAVAQQIQRHTLKYFEDRFAGWIVDQGGWESVVEDINTEDDSELD